MKKKLIVLFIILGAVQTIMACVFFSMFYGAMTYTKRCAHIADKQGVTCETGDTLYIDGLAYFSNYDERRITGIADGEGFVSEDGTSVTITKANGFATVYVYATNDKAPESTDHAIKVMIKDA